MPPPNPSLIERTVQPRYPNGERKLARNAFMQLTWGLLVLAFVIQVLVFLGLDILS